MFVSRNIFDWLPVGVIAGLWTVGIHWGPSTCDMHPDHGHASRQACTKGNLCIIRTSCCSFRVVQKKILFYSSSIVLNRIFLCLGSVILITTISFQSQWPAPLFSVFKTLAVNLPRMENFDIKVKDAMGLNVVQQFSTKDQDMPFSHLLQDLFLPGRKSLKPCCSVLHIVWLICLEIFELKVLINNSGEICTVLQRYRVKRNGQDFLFVQRNVVCFATHFTVFCDKNCWRTVLNFWLGMCQVTGRDLLGHFQLLQSCLVQSLRGTRPLKTS